MGIDVEIYIRTIPTKQAMDQLRAMRSERRDDGECRWPVLDSVYCGQDGDHIRISSCARYFGKWYPRGWWPDIKETLLALRDACPPGTQIEYGSDSSDSESGVPISDEWFAEMDALWAQTGKVE